MNTYIITRDGTVAVTRSGEPLPEDSVDFSTAAELAKAVANWPMGRLVALWNGLPGVTVVRRFTDRATAVRRIWRAIAQRQEGRPVTRRGQKTRVAGRKRKSGTGRPGRSHSKGAEVLRMLRQPGGATLQALISMTGWQAHSVRGFLSRTAKLQGLKIRSARTDNGRVYSIRG